MTRRDWHDGEHVLGMFLNGARARRRPARTASEIEDDSFLVLFNAHHEDGDVHAAPPAVRRAVDARALDGGPGARSAGASATAPAREVAVIARSIVILKRVRMSGGASELRATYRLQLTRRRFGFAAARGS